MLISKQTPINVLEVWYPKYSTQYTDKKERVVLLADYKIREHNKVIFTKAKHLLGREYYIAGHVAKSYPIVSNGTIPCREIPMSVLDNLEYKEEVAQIAKNLFTD